MSIEQTVFEHSNDETLLREVKGLQNNAVVVLRSALDNELDPKIAVGVLSVQLELASDLLRLYIDKRYGQEGANVL